MIKPHCCPICDKQFPGDPASQTHFPFCSDRCRKVDLFRWLDGKYAVVEDIDPEVARFLELEAETGPQGEGMEQDHLDTD